MKEKNQHILPPFFIVLVSPGLERPAFLSGPASRANILMLTFFETFISLFLCLKKFLLKKEIAESLNVENWN